MILAETLECTVPSPNAVKDLVIHCVTAPTNATDISTSIATWATAGFTLLLAVFALLAWRNAQATLAKLETQIIDQRKANEESIKAAAQLAVDSRQIGYMASYCSDLLALGDAALHLADIRALKNSCTNSWMHWGMEMFKVDKDFRELIGRWNKHIAEECDVYQNSYPHWSKVEQEKYSAILMTKIGQFVGNLQHWQVDPAERPAAEERFRTLDDILNMP